MLQDPIGIRRYGLPSSAFLTEAREILDSVNTFTTVGQEVPVLPDLFILDPGYFRRGIDTLARSSLRPWACTCVYATYAGVMCVF